jgi:TPR repeat protein
VLALRAGAGRGDAMLNVKRCLFIAGACLLTAAEPAAAAKWVEVKSPNFTVYSDAGEREAREVAQQFEQVRLAFERVWSGARTRTAKPIAILAARDSQSLRALLPDYFERKDAKDIGGVAFTGAHKIFVALAADDRSEQAFARLGYNPYHLHFHEYIHVLTALNVPGVPPWLGEGLAEFFGATIVEGDRLVLGKPLPWHIFDLREREMLPLTRLLAVDHDSPEYTQHGKSGVFYAQSWALLHMLIMDPSGEGAQRVNGMLRRLRRGEDGLEASRAELGDLAALEKQLNRYVRRPGFQYGRNDFDARVSAKAFPAREVAPAEALAVQGDFHAHRGEGALARRLLEQALQQDPKLALAHEALGYLTWREKSLAEAVPFFQRAAESGGGFLAHYLLGLARLEQEGPEALDQANAALTKAVDANTDSAPAYEALARALGRRGEGSAERALGFARRAVSLEPSDPGHRVTLSWLLSLSGRRDDALSEARRALTLARQDGDRQRAQQWLDTLSQEASRPAASAQSGQALAPVVVSRRPPAEQDQACGAGQLAECFALGDRYASGDGVERDPARALGAYQRACDGGLVQACLSLAGAHLAGTLGARDPVAAVSATARGCDAGHALSCAHAGLMLSTTSEVPRDDARAAGLLKKGCEADVAPACGGLALLHVSGRGGLARDPVRAAALLEKACSADEALSCAHLAGLYEAGVGVAKDAARARELYAGACAKGVPNACAKAGAAPK